MKALGGRRDWSPAEGSTRGCGAEGNTRGGCAEEPAWTMTLGWGTMGRDTGAMVVGGEMGSVGGGGSGADEEEEEEEVEGTGGMVRGCGMGTAWPVVERLRGSEWARRPAKGRA